MQVGPTAHRFHVKFVEHAGRDCANPYFPSIHIRSEQEYDAWVQLVYTDSIAKEWNVFVDASPSVDPYYTFERDFYDSPSWNYTLFFKPLSFWTGHAYAIKIDENRKIIQYKGGIQWGFRLSYLHLYPQMTLPTFLDHAAWLKDWEIIRKNLPGYKSAGINSDDYRLLINLHRVSGEDIGERGASHAVDEPGA